MQRFGGGRKNENGHQATKSARHRPGGALRMERRMATSLERTLALPPRYRGLAVPFGFVRDVQEQPGSSTGFR